MFKIGQGWVAGGMLLALIAAPGRTDVRQVKLGTKGAT